MSQEKEQLEAVIAALEAQRPLLGDDVVSSLLVATRSRVAALSAPTQHPLQAEQRLKQITLLVMDVVGSTALSLRLDPEAISAVMDDALARGTALVQAHQGRVLQYAGDNILAGFGVDEAREDDAERAVHCGLALLQLGSTLAAEVRARHDHGGFGVRVGIHTGGVLLGGGVDGDDTIRGIAVKVASSMEQTAPAGALRISHDTYGQVRGSFEVDAQESIAVQGVDAPVRTYLVRRAKPRPFCIGARGIEGVPTRMIGRDAELEALQTAFHLLFEQRKLSAVTVVAEAGIGKSRLLYEFDAWSETQPERFVLFRCRATPTTGTQAFGLLRDIVAWRFHIHDDDSIEAARAKMEDGIVPLFLHDDGPDVAQGHAHLLGHLIGIEWTGSRHVRGILDDPKQIRNRAFHAAAQLFRRLSSSKGRPVVLQLEDLHWADNESLDFLNYLAEVNRDVPLLILGFTRPSLFERRFDWSSTEARHQRIDLLPLDKRASRELANELLKKLPVLPAALRDLLTGSADGNPFYMEELVKMLIDQGAIQTGATWSIDAEQLVLTQVPATLTGVIQARLDGLPWPERRALQQASVVGTVFWDQALAAIEKTAADQLPALVRRELALPRADGLLEGLREYAFRHQLMHQVIYDTVLKRHRREGHARVARWLAGMAAERLLRAGDLLGLAADHFELAGAAEEAAEYHARAAEHAGQRMAHDRVLAHVARALALLGPAPDTMDKAQGELRWRLLCAREQTLSLVGRQPEHADDLAAMASLADKLDEDGRRAYAAWRISRRAVRTADWPAVERAAGDSVRFARRAGDAPTRLQALRYLAYAQIYRGEIEAGRRAVLAGLAEARSLDLAGLEAGYLNLLTIVAQQQSDPVGMLDLAQQCLDAERRAGNRVNEAVSLLNLGGVRLLLGDFPQARRDLNDALAAVRANGDRVSEGVAFSALSNLALMQGDETQALVLASTAVDIAKGTQARDREVQCLNCLADAELALGRYDSAERHYERARAMACELERLWQHDARAGLARVALARRDLAAALNAVQPILAHVAAGSTLDGTECPRSIELTVYQTLSAAGDNDAIAWLDRAHAALMRQAEAVTDPALRQGLLRNIPHHRVIVEAWNQRGVAGSASPA